MAGIAQRLVERLTLRGAIAAARAADPSLLAPRRRALAAAAQKLAAADALRPLGQRAEALGLLVDALTQLVAAAGAGDDAQALASLGVTEPGAVARVLAVRRGGPALLDASFTEQDERDHARLLVATHAALRGLRPLASTAVELRARVASRVVGVSTLLVVAAALAVVVAVPRPRVLLRPSVEHGPAYLAPNARDGNPATAWLLPDHTAGHLDLVLTPPRDVHAVTLLNTQNAPYFDRATRGWAVELWRGVVRVAVREGEWEFSRTPTPVEIAVAGERIDRIRFVVRSHHQLGAGLAEISFR
jgi:hypothetical protein